jgi:glycosyltransferase involved in cell wall biosynthesis
MLFAGHLDRPQVWALLDRCSALIHVPKSEGFGIVVPEAMAVGLPVVVSGVGGLTDIVREGLDGWIVGSGDIAAMARALGSLLESPDRAREMGEAGRERVRSAFSLKESQDRVFAICRRVARDPDGDEPSWPERQTPRS